MFYGGNPAEQSGLSEVGEGRMEESQRNRTANLEKLFSDVWEYYCLMRNKTANEVTGYGKKPNYFFRNPDEVIYVNLCASWDAHSKTGLQERVHRSVSEPADYDNGHLVKMRNYDFHPQSVCISDNLNGPSAKYNREKSPQTTHIGSRSLQSTNNDCVQLGLSERKKIGEKFPGTANVGYSCRQAVTSHEDSECTLQCISKLEKCPVDQGVLLKNDNKEPVLDITTNAPFSKIRRENAYNDHGKMLEYALKHCKETILTDENENQLEENLDKSSIKSRSSSIRRWQVTTKFRNSSLKSDSSDMSSTNETQVEEKTHSDEYEEEDDVFEDDIETSYTNDGDNREFCDGSSQKNVPRRKTSPFLNYVGRYSSKYRLKRSSVGSRGNEVPRSPAQRKRDSLLRRRHNSTPAITASPLSTPVVSTTSNTNSLKTANMSDSRQPFEHGSESIKINISKTDSICKQDSLDPLIYDIIGDTCDARFPWQKDVSTQCNIAVSSCILNESDKCPQRMLAPRSLPSMGSLHVPGSKLLERPHSVGCIHGTVQSEELERLRQDQLRFARKSDSFLQISPRLQRKRLSLAVSDDNCSGSDLGSISEIPDFECDNSIVEDGEASNLSHALQHLARNSSSLANQTNHNSSTWSEQRENDVSYSDSEDMSSTEFPVNMFLTVPGKPSRTTSSCSVTSASDENEIDPSTALLRRGRRAAIVDTKNFGDVSPTNLSPENSPSNSCDEGEHGANIAERLRRRKSSVDLEMSMYPGDLLVHEHHKKLVKRNTIADFFPNRHSSNSFVDDNKKRQSFSILKLMRTRSKESLPRMEDVLSQMKPTEFKDNHLTAYKNLHWSDLIASSDKLPETISIPEVERKRREAVWELFKSECVYLIDHLMVLKHCFMEPLKKLQVEGHLMYAEPHDIFGNLDELCYVSYTFCKDFISALLKDMSCTDFGSTSVLVRSFERFTAHSRDGGVYHSYCVNYVNALTYLNQLRKNDDFKEFENWCCQDQRCNRLKLSDLLVAPMQHCTKFPLLLGKIKKYTQDEMEQRLLGDLIEKVEASLQKMEDKMKWARNYERLQEIQEQLIWPPVSDLEPRAFIPEGLRQSLARQPCESLLCNAKRRLVHEGFLTLIETTKSYDVYVFLFNDIFLITKTKKQQKKTSNSVDRLSYMVFKQPIPIYGMSLYDITTMEASHNLRNSFAIIQISRFQQIVGVFTLQAPSESSKARWIDSFKETQLMAKRSRRTSVPDERSQNENGISNNIVRASSQQRCNRKLRGTHGKSLSMDAVYL